ncbi:MAG: energy-coupling factor transporter transmembrane component T family protein [Bacillaceae bacterium]
MLQNIAIGRYIPAQSYIHAMDARSKLVFVFAFIISIFLANNVWTYTALTVFVIGILFLSKISMRYILSSFKPILWILLFTFVLQIFTNKTGNLLVKFLWFEIYDGGIIQAIFMSIRFFLLIGVTTLLTLTTTPIEITDGIERLFHPLKKLKIPVHEVALMLSISLRFIPTLIEETDKIAKAQMARGVDFSTGPLKERIKSIVALLVPLFVNSFKRAEDLAVAMESRGYRGGVGRTKYRQSKWGYKDTLALFTLGAIIGLLLLLRNW